MPFELTHVPCRKVTASDHGGDVIKTRKSAGKAHQEMQVPR